MQIDLTYDEAMSVISENVAVYNDRFKGIFYKYKKIGGATVWSWKGGLNSFPIPPNSKEKRVTWHLYEPECKPFSYDEAMSVVSNKIAVTLVYYPIDDRMVPCNFYYIKDSDGILRSYSNRTDELTRIQEIYDKEKAVQWKICFEKCRNVEEKLSTTPAKRYAKFWEYSANKMFEFQDDPHKVALKIKDLKLPQEQKMEKEKFDFFRAMELLKLGKMVYSDHGGMNYIYQWDNGQIAIKGRPEVTCPNIDANEMRADWYVYAPEEKGENASLITRLENAPSCKHGFNLTVNNFYKMTEMKAYYKALQTFMELRMHPLARKIVNEKEQHTISLDNILAGKPLEHLTGSCFFAWYKQARISPVFDSREDALKALSDIGLDRLRQMANTFAGIYE